MKSRHVLRAVLAAATLAACSRGPRPAAPPGPAPLDTTRHVLVPRDTTDTSGRRAITTQTAPSPKPATPAGGTKPAASSRCILDLTNTEETRSQFVRDSATGKYTTFVGGGIRGKCRNQDITVVADSAESYDERLLYFLIGNVHYREPRVSIDADRVTYFRTDERLLFENNVKVQLPDGSAVLVGPHAEYYRAVQGVRAQSRMVAAQRPTLTYIEKDSLGRVQPPVTLIANVIIGEGDSTYYGVGKVDIVRNDLVAHADSAFMDENRRFSRLMKQPVIESKGSQPFTLRGRVIDLFGEARALDRVIAVDSATAVSKDLTLRSDTIDLRLTASQLNRAFAFGPEGASAVSPDRTIIADSLDIQMPAQRLREMHAVGKAYAESDPDTAKILSDERDWLRGDTIVARFDSVPASDTAARPQVRDLVAIGRASSYYHIPNEKGDRSHPGVNYARGGQIRLDFTTRDKRTEARRVTIDGKAAGIYLRPDTTAAGAAKKPPPGSPIPPRKPPR